MATRVLDQVSAAFDIANVDIVCLAYTSLNGSLIKVNTSNAFKLCHYKQHRVIDNGQARLTGHAHLSG